MGFKEDLISDWSNKSITYQGVNMFVVQQIEYKGKTYLYALDKDSLEKNKENIEAAFLYKIEDDIFANVDDNDLFDELLSVVAGNYISNKVKKVFGIV